jgi:hypothetical protein
VLPADVQSIAANAFPDSCEVSRECGIAVIDLVLIGLNKQEKKKRHGKLETNERANKNSKGGKLNETEQKG